MNIPEYFLEVGKSFFGAIWNLVFGEVILNPPMLAFFEEELGDLNPVEEFFLTFKKRLTMSGLLPFEVVAVIIDEMVAFSMRLRFPLVDGDVIRICPRRVGNKIVVALTETLSEDVELAFLMFISATRFEQSSIEKSAGVQKKRKLRKVKVWDPLALLPDDDGDEFFVSGCPYKWALFCNTCSYRFACHISLPKRELAPEEAFA